MIFLIVSIVLLLNKHFATLYCHICYELWICNKIAKTKLFRFN